MPRLGPLFAAVIPSAVVAGMWLRLEEPRREGQAALVLAFALVPLLLRPWWGWGLAVLAGALATLWIAFSASPSELVGTRTGWWERVGDRADTALRDFNEVLVPFDSNERWELHGLLLVVIFVAAVGIGLSARVGRQLWGVAIVLLAVAVPATVLEQRVGFSSGIVVLASCLWLVAGARGRLARGDGRALVVGGAVVLVAAAAAGAGGAPSSSAVDWKNWDLYSHARGQVGVGYVWAANYNGIRFPEKPTTVLRVRASGGARYWRASTLDAFEGRRWVEYLFPLRFDAPRGRLPVEALLPAAARDVTGWVRQQVEVVGLRSNRLPAASTPVALESSSLARVSFLGGGVLGYREGVAPGQRYTVWSHVARPQPAQLAASRPRYPEETARYLTLGGGQLPPFGVPSRDEGVSGVLSSPYHKNLLPYRAVWQQARRLTGDARSPYAATLALERWFRSGGGFVYDEQPPRPPEGGLPPLADFVLRTKRGYCQHYAGAMTLMLRLLGIPARVAVGFTSGSLEDGAWTVTDYDAHAWVEVWFDGWGWLPFDPTPGRGAFAGSYSLASDSADAVNRLGGRPFVPQGRAPIAPGAVSRSSGAGDEDGMRSWPAWMALALLGGAVAVGLVKEGRRRWRYRGHDPRRIASAARAELADRLVDQGVRLPPGASLGDVTRGLRRFGLTGATFARATARARYGPLAGATVAAAESRRELRSLVRALRRSLPLHRRIRGYLSLRSLRAGS